jgi:hypothetical protein
MHARIAQSRLDRSIVVAMKPVPGWFAAACWLVAIACSVLAGYHYNVPNAARWISLYGGAGIAAAVLSSSWRLLAFAALGAGVADAVWCGLELGRLWNAAGAADLWPLWAVAAAAAWLVVGALIRMLLRF